MEEWSRLSAARRVAHNLQEMRHSEDPVPNEWSPFCKNNQT